MHGVCMCVPAYVRIHVYMVCVWYGMVYVCVYGMWGGYGVYDMHVCMCALLYLMRQGGKAPH